MFATDYLETINLNALRAQSAAAPPTLYVGLYYTSPTETGTSGSEVAYSGYTRKPVVFDAPELISGTNYGIKNSADIQYPAVATAMQDILYVGVSDALTGGNMYLYGAFDEPMQLQAGDNPVLVAGELRWWIEGAMSDNYKQACLNYLRGNNLGGFTPCLSLWNGDPQSGGGELSGIAYARPAVTFTAPAEQPSGQMQIATSLDIAFPRAGGAWGTWAYTVLMDSGTAGNVIMITQETSNRAVRKNDQIHIATGAYTVSLH